MTADTHVPKRARELPHSLWSAIEAAAVVVHAGDWVDAALLDQLETRSRRLIGVYGNNDHGTLRERLPEVARAEIEGVRIAVVHETGDKKGREQGCAARFPDTHVLVFGHHHLPWDTPSAHGLPPLHPPPPPPPRPAPRPPPRGPPGRPTSPPRPPPARRPPGGGGRRARSCRRWPRGASCGTPPPPPSRPAGDHRPTAGGAGGGPAGLPGL